MQPLCSWMSDWLRARVGGWLSLSSLLSPLHRPTKQMTVSDVVGRSRRRSERIRRGRRNRRRNGGDGAHCAIFPLAHSFFIPLSLVGITLAFLPARNSNRSLALAPAPASDSGTHALCIRPSNGVNSLQDWVCWWDPGSGLSGKRIKENRREQKWTKEKEKGRDRFERCVWVRVVVLCVERVLCKLSMVCVP